MEFINVFFKRKQIPYNIEKKDENNKNGNTEKLTLPFPHFLWMIGISAGATKGKTVLHEPKAEQENVNGEYEEENDADMLAVIAQASNCHAMRPALVLDGRTYTYQELFGLAGSICETLRNLKEDIIGITAENRIETYASILAVLFSGKPMSCCIPIIQQSATVG